jgi:hypothetical protein
MKPETGKACIDLLDFCMFCRRPLQNSVCENQGCRSNLPGFALQDMKEAPVTDGDFTKITPIENGFCFICQEPLRCPNGCYRKEQYQPGNGDPGLIVIAIDSGECIICWEKVNCPSNHL